MTSIDVIKMIDNHLYIPTTRLHKQNAKGKGLNIELYPFKAKGTAIMAKVMNIDHIALHFKLKMTTNPKGYIILCITFHRFLDVVKLF